MRPPPRINPSKKPPHHTHRHRHTTGSSPTPVDMQKDPSPPPLHRLGVVEPNDEPVRILRRIRDQPLGLGPPTVPRQRLTPPVVDPRPSVLTPPRTPAHPPVLDAGPTRSRLDPKGIRQVVQPGGSRVRPLLTGPPFNQPLRPEPSRGRTDLDPPPAPQLPPTQRPGRGVRTRRLRQDQLTPTPGIREQRRTRRLRSPRGHRTEQQKKGRGRKGENTGTHGSDGRARTR
jgi:hypothetical protein